MGKYVWSECVRRDRDRKGKSQPRRHSREKITFEVGIGSQKGGNSTPLWRYGTVRNPGSQDCMKRCLLRWLFECLEPKLRN